MSQIEISRSQVKGFGLLDLSKDRDSLIVELYESTTFAHRIANAMGVSSFRQSCAAIAGKVHCDGMQRVPQLNGERLSVFGKQMSTCRGDRWLALAFFEDSCLSKQLPALSAAQLVDSVITTFMQEKSHAVLSSKLKNLTLLVSKMAVLLEGGSLADKGLRKKFEEHRMALQAALMHKEEDHSGGVSSSTSSPREDEEEPEFAWGLAPKVIRGKLRLKSGLCSSADKFLVEQSWRIAGASVWQLQSNRQPKLRVELFKSRSFALEVTSASQAKSFRHLCHGMAERFVRTGSLQFNNWKYQVYGRVIKQRLGPNFVCIIVFDGRDINPSMTENLERLSHTHFVAHIANAFAQHSDHRMSKKLANIRGCLKLLGDLKRKNEEESEFLLMVRKKVDGLLDTLAERKQRTRPKRFSPTLCDVSPDSQVSSGIDSFEPLPSAVTVPSGIPSVSSAESAQAHLISYLMTSNNEMAQHNRVLMDRIAALTQDNKRLKDELKVYKAMSGQINYQASAQALNQWVSQNYYG